MSCAAYSQDGPVKPTQRHASQPASAIDAYGMVQTGPGSGAIVLPGVTVGENSVVGAGNTSDGGAHDG